MTEHRQLADLVRVWSEDQLPDEPGAVAAAVERAVRARESGDSLGGACQQGIVFATAWARLRSRRAHHQGSA